MPTAEAVLSWASRVANDWRWLAIFWHIALGVFLIGAIRARLPERGVARLLVLPIVSVAILATVSGNPFNAIAFAILAVALLRSTSYLSATRAPVTSQGWLFAGVPLIAVGWLYPHFLVADTWIAYAYASPFGLLPCPTLLVVIGATLAVGASRAAGWNSFLVVAGITYGAIGVFRLGVVLDVWLFVGATMLATQTLVERIAARVRATKEERTRSLPGDELIPHAAGAMTHAITLGRGPSAVWPWIAQMGAGSRGGWYSYDFIDNRRRPSARQIIPNLQHISVGDIFPALPGVTEGFVLLAFAPAQSLVLGWRNPDGSPMVTWAFVLEQQPDNRTRLIVRARYRTDSPRWLPLFVIRLEHFVMQRKQLLGIAQRVEWSTHATEAA